VPTRLTRKLAADYDRLLRRTFTALLRMPVSDAAWDEVMLPMRLRATGLSIATASSAAPGTFHHHDFRRSRVDAQESSRPGYMRRSWQRSSVATRTRTPRSGTASSCLRRERGHGCTPVPACTPASTCRRPRAARRLRCTPAFRCSAPNGSAVRARIRWTCTGTMRWHAAAMACRSGSKTPSVTFVVDLHKAARSVCGRQAAGPGRPR
jgi:hypothetical protein